MDLSTAAIKGEIEDFASTIHIERINRFPHRMINIRHIQKEGGNLSYYLNLQTSDNEVRAVEMNDGARLYDYLNAFDMHKEESIDFDSIQKKVFKPDSRYLNLLVPCLPHTFYKGRNMQSDLDYCLEWYILSPFDYKSAKILRQSIPNGVNALQKLIESVLDGAQFRKCVSYIMKKRHVDTFDKETAEESIKKEYEEFITCFYRLLENYQSQKKPPEKIRH